MRYVSRVFLVLVTIAAAGSVAHADIPQVAQISRAMVV